MDTLERLISGGQTGVDRAALDVARELGIPSGGWCPQGRRAVDGPIPEKYPLAETAARSYNKRTKLNVRDSDGTLIINRGELDGGTAYTVARTEQLGKPCLMVEVDDSPDSAALLAWFDRHQIKTLNVAGPREDKRPGIYQQARSFLRSVLA